MLRAEEPPIVFSRLDYLVVGLTLLVTLIMVAYIIVSFLYTPEVVWSG